MSLAASVMMGGADGAVMMAHARVCAVAVGADACVVGLQADGFILAGRCHHMLHSTPLNSCQDDVWDV